MGTILGAVVWLLIYITKNGNERTIESTNKQALRDEKHKLEERGFVIKYWGPKILVLLLIFSDFYLTWGGEAFCSGYIELIGEIEKLLS